MDFFCFSIQDNNTYGIVTEDRIKKFRNHLFSHLNILIEIKHVRDEWFVSSVGSFNDNSDLMFKANLVGNEYLKTHGFDDTSAIFMYDNNPDHECVDYDVEYENYDGLELECPIGFYPLLRLYHKIGKNYSYENLMDDNDNFYTVAGDYVTRLNPMRQINFIDAIDRTACSLKPFTDVLIKCSSENYKNLQEDYSDFCKKANLFSDIIPFEMSGKLIEPNQNKAENSEK